MEPNRRDDGQAQDAPLTTAQQARKRPEFSWPWGLVAIGVMALAWVGIYLLWNGIVFLFNR